jgi:hypothetical protein
MKGLLDDFFMEFSDTFGETDKIRTATTKLWSLRQGSHPASVYTVDFRQLVCNVDLDDNALISAFYWGLRDDVKDLLLNLPDPLTLTEAITQAVWCKNQLFEIDRSGVRYKGRIRLKPLLHGISINQCIKVWANTNWFFELQEATTKGERSTTQKRLVFVLWWRKITKLEIAL